MELRILRNIDLVLGSVFVVLLRPASILLGKMLRRDHELTVRRQLAIVKLRGGGSLLVALPALLSLRQRYPSQRFTIVTTADVVPFAEMMGIFDDFVIVRSNSPVALLSSALAALRRVWLADGLINLEIHSRLTTVFSCLSCARNRFGFYHESNSWQRDVITHLFFFNITSPVYVNYNQVAKSLGASILPYEVVCAHFNSVNGLKFLRSERDGLPKVVLAPFCSELGKEREFSNEHWGRVLLSRFGNISFELTIVGVSSNRANAEALSEHLRSILPAVSVSNLAGMTTLAQCALIIGAADHFMTIDSGLNHIARLVCAEVNIVSFWGPTDPETRLAPFPNLKEEVVYRKLFCSPCVHVVSSPPCKGNNICMKQYLAGGVDHDSSDGWMIISDSAVPRRV
jgi:ADP-heptose:LPS heptosyltransferase